MEINIFGEGENEEHVGRVDEGETRKKTGKGE